MTCDWWLRNSLCRRPAIFAGCTTYSATLSPSLISTPVPACSASRVRSESNGTDSRACNSPSRRKLNYIPSSIRAVTASIWAGCLSSTIPTRTAFWRAGRTVSRPMRTLELLTNINAALKPDIIYAERHEPGTQSPAQTLETKTGACRDFAMVFIEAARYLGFGARFVSGYLYDPALDRGDATQAGAATHASPD